MKTVLLTCPGCDRKIKVYRPAHDPDEPYFFQHYLNSPSITTGDDRGSRCINSGAPLVDAIVVPFRGTRVVDE